MPLRQCHKVEICAVVLMMCHQRVISRACKSEVQTNSLMISSRQHNYSVKTSICVEANVMLLRRKVELDKQKPLRSRDSQNDIQQGWGI